MRFVILTQYFEPEVGAAQMRLGSIVRQLGREGHEVDVVTSMPSYPQGRIQNGYRGKVFQVEQCDGFRVSRVWSYPATGRGIKRLLNYLSFTFACLLPLLRQRRPTHLFVESPPLFLILPAWVASKFWRCRLVFNVADLWPDVAVDLGAITPGPVLTFAVALERLAYESADYITVATEGIRSALVERKGVPSHKIILLPNGVDPNRFSPGHRDEQVAKRLNLLSRPFVLFPGTVALVNDLDSVADAVIQLNEAGRELDFVILGSGSDQPRMANKYRSHTCIRFIEPIPPDELAAILPFAALGVVSLADIPANQGARPSKLFPFMASSIPVLYCGSGEGAALVTEAGAGQVVPAGDVPRIAAALSNLVDDPELRASVGSQGRRYVSDRLSWDKVVRSWLDGMGN
jgi:glycosyltransferase involved in cell wall biosynthesis